MDTDAEMLARHCRLLARFSDQASSLADDLRDSAREAETASDKQALSLAFHRTGRGLRQTCALEAKLRREAKADARDEVQAVERAEKAHRERRKAEVRASIARLVWTEYEPSDDEALDVLEKLDTLLDAEADIEGFTLEALQAQIARLCLAIGYVPPVPPPRGEVSPQATEGASTQTGPPPHLYDASG